MAALLKRILTIAMFSMTGKIMNIAAMTFRLHAPWVHSLKEKRMIVNSLVFPVAESLSYF